jgi:DNA-binding CsgD family transcriptional regulator
MFKVSEIIKKNSTPLVPVLAMHYYEVDARGTFLSSNLAQAQNWGVSSVQDMIGMNVQDFPWLPPYMLSAIITNNRSIIASESSRTFVEPGKLKNGHRFVSLSYKTPLQCMYTKKTIGITGHSFIIECKYTKTDIATSCILTPQQIQCIICLIKGMTTKQIATTLGLSHRTVEHYLSDVKERLQCYNRMQLIENALKIPLILERVFFESWSQ